MTAIGKQDAPRKPTARLATVFARCSPTARLAVGGVLIQSLRLLLLPPFCGGVNLRARGQGFRAGANRRCGSYRQRLKSYGS
jgi:hypothetical protein